MSPNRGGADGSEMACKHCGRDDFGNAGALARHEGACEGADADANEPSANGDRELPNALHADDVEVHEIANVLPNMRERDLKETLAFHDYHPTDRDTLETACAKALLKAKNAGPDGYRTVFGPCDEPDCEYGRNGFGAAYCSRHGSEQDREPSGGSDTDTDTDAPAAPNRVRWHGVPVPIDVGGFERDAHGAGRLEWTDGDDTVAVRMSAHTGEYDVEAPDTDPAHFADVNEAIGFALAALGTLADAKLAPDQPAFGEGAEPPKGEEEAGMLPSEAPDERAAYVAALIRNGAKPSEAEAAAKVRFGGE